MKRKGVKVMGALPEYLTPHEIADLLRLSYDKALDFIKYSGVRYARFGRQYRVDKKDLMAFLTQKGNIDIDLQNPIR